MLVLSRRVGEKIVINGNIEVTVVSVKGDRVRIGVSAPKDISVDREEIHTRRTHFDDDVHSSLVVVKKVQDSLSEASESSVGLGDHVCYHSSSDTVIR